VYSLGRRSENMSFSHNEVSYGEHDEGDFFQLPSSSEYEIELNDGTDSDGAESGSPADSGRQVDCECGFDLCSCRKKKRGRVSATWGTGLKRTCLKNEEVAKQYVTDMRASNCRASRRTLKEKLGTISDFVVKNFLRRNGLKCRQCNVATALTPSDAEKRLQAFRTWFQQHTTFGLYEDCPNRRNSHQRVRCDA
jgi:hypothetical protein